MDEEELAALVEGLDALTEIFENSGGFELEGDLDLGELGDLEGMEDLFGELEGLLEEFGDVFGEFGDDNSNDSGGSSSVATTKTEL